MSLSVGLPRVNLKCLLRWHQWEIAKSRSVGGGVEIRTYRCTRCPKISQRRVRL